MKKWVRSHVGNGASVYFSTPKLLLEKSLKKIYNKNKENKKKNGRGYFRKRVLLKLLAHQANFYILVWVDLESSLDGWHVAK